MPTPIDATGFGLAGAPNVSTSNGNFNQFEGLGGDDTITGNGNTRVIYSNATAGVTLTIGAGGAGSALGSAVTRPRRPRQLHWRRQRAMGSNFADTIIGSSASETLDGNGGNDTLNGGGGLDTFFGGAGSDNFIFASGSTAGATVVDFAGNGDGGRRYA